MDLLSPTEPTQRVTVMKGAQLGFTECALNFVFYTIDHAPASMLFVQKTIENIRRFSKQRVEKSVRLMDSVSEKVGKQRARDGNSSTLMKSFPGGMLILGGANSAASLRSMPIQNLVLDEEDSFVADLEGEGSPGELAIRRTANFPRRKIFRLSTPAIKETSSIEPTFESGSRERYYVPCPHCNHYQVLWWAQMKWNGDEHLTVRFECVKCKALIPEHHKTWMLEHGEWRAEDPDNAHKSFHISALYSPLGFFSWAEAAEMFIRATRNHDKGLLKVFVNTVLGETWAESGRSIESSWLQRRCELYLKPIPSEALLLTAGADVQEDRIEVEVVGWGRNLENWSIDYNTIMGDTEYDWVWEQLDMYLLRTWEHTSGTHVPIAGACIDSGHRAKRVYDFVRPREFRRVFAVKGQDGFGRGYIRRPLHRNDHGIWRFTRAIPDVN
jgi:phage terminase large subunit GpA-like protein